MLLCKEKCEPQFEYKCLEEKCRLSCMAVKNRMRWVSVHISRARLVQGERGCGYDGIREEYRVVTWYLVVWVNWNICHNCGHCNTVPLSSVHQWRIRYHYIGLPIRHISALSEVLLLEFLQELYFLINFYQFKWLVLVRNRDNLDFYKTVK